MRRSAAPAALMLTVALSACGSSGPSLSDYKKGFQTNKTQFRQLGSDLQNALQTARGKSDAQLAGEFASLAARATQQAQSLRKLKPPSKYKSQNDQLATDFDTVAADMRSISSAASSNDANAARAGTTKLLQDASSLRSMDQSITASLGLPQT